MLRLLLQQPANWARTRSPLFCKAVSWIYEFVVPMKLSYTSWFLMRTVTKNTVVSLFLYATSLMSYLCAKYAAITHFFLKTDVNICAIILLWETKVLQTWSLHRTTQSIEDENGDISGVYGCADDQNAKTQALQRVRAGPGNWSLLFCHPYAVMLPFESRFSISDGMR